MRKHAWLVFLISCLGTFALWLAVRHSNEEILRARFHRQVSLITGNIREELASNERVLRGCAGLFAVLPQTTRKIWAEYVAHLDLPRTLPGIQGLGFARRVADSDLAAHVREIQAEGFASYSVRPPGERAEYFPIIFLEPFRDANLRAFGYDMFGESVRRSAMERARDEHLTVLSGMVTLVQEGVEAKIQHGFVMYHPVYVNGSSPESIPERRQSLHGFVYLPVRFGDFFDQIVFQNTSFIGLCVYDGEVIVREHLAYESSDCPRSEKLPASYVPAFEDTLKLSACGRVWSVRFFSLPQFDAVNESTTPWYVLAFGLCASILLGTLVHFIDSRRTLQAARELNLALAKVKGELENRLYEQTVDLKKTNRLLRLLSDVNKALNHAESENQLLEKIVDLVIRVGGYKCCLVAFVEHDPAQSLRPVAQRGWAEGSLQNLALTWAETGEGQFPLGTAVRTRQTVVDNDIAGKPVCQFWCHESEISGAGSLAAFPLISFEAPIAVMGIYSPQAEAFDPIELVTLEEVAEDLAYGIEIQRSRLARLRAEEELRRSEKNLREAQALAHIGNWSANPATQETFFSEEMCRIAGRDTSLLSITYPEVVALFTPEDWKRSLEAVEVAAASGKPCELETELLRQDGTTCWVHATENVRKDALGQVIELYGTKQDITQRKQMQDELKKREEKYRLLVDHLQVGVVVYSSAAEILFCNLLAAEFFGLPPGELAGMGCFEFVRVPLREDMTPLTVPEHPVSRVLASGQPLQGQIVGISQPGAEKIIWIQMNAFPEFNRQNQVERVVVTMMDITALKLAEAELKAHRESLEKVVAERTSRLESVINTATDGMVIISSDGRISSFNPAAERIFGYQALEVINQSVFLLAPEPFRSQGIEHLKGFTETGSPNILGTGLELIGARKDGMTFPMELSVAEFSMADKRMFSIVVRDISVRRRVEDTLKTAKDEALKASRAKSDFVANVSHEIRTPLNAIIGFANLAMKTSLNEKQIDYLGKIHLSGMLLHGLINDLLDFSKIEAGKLTMENIAFSFVDVVNHVVAMMGPPAAAKDLNIIVNIPVSFPNPLVGDSLRLGQVLTNIMSNAIKFTEHGEICLTASYRQLTDLTIELLVEISDTGIGVNPENLTKIFLPFTQADLSTTRRFGGTGLGLTICKRLVELMGGKINIKSELGNGTLVSFTAEFKIGSGEKGEEILPDNLLNLRVLVLETHSAMLAWFRAFFKQFPFLVDVVSTVSDALSALAEKGQEISYDLFLIDSQGISGGVLTLLQNLRSHPDPWNHPKVILLVTSPLEDSLREQAIGLEVREFMFRPLTPTSMIRAINNVFAPQRHKRISTSAQSADDLDLDGLHILVVEDNAMNQQIARELLESVGISVSLAGNGRIAVDTLLSETEPVFFDAILMDIQMPEMDGYEATRRIREIPRFARTPIIAMTAHAMAEERERVDSAGMNDHVAKPIIPNDLYRTLRRWTRLAGSEKPSILDVKKDRPVDPRDTTEVVPPIPGVNVREGVARFGGKAKTYLRFLRELPANQQAEMQKVEQALTMRDLAGARTLIHTLKGLVGNLALTDLFQAAESLERALREPDWVEGVRRFAFLRDAFATFSLAIQALDVAPSTVLGVGAETSPKTALSPRVRELFGELKKMLSGNDSQSRQCFMALAAEFACPADCLSDFHSLEVAIGQFEFDQALQLLASIETKVKEGT